MTFKFRGLTMPKELADSLQRYANHRVPTGSFLRACLENDLMKAVARASDMSVIPVVACYIYNELPSSCHGSAAKIDEWLKGHSVERNQHTIHHLDK